MNSIALHYCLAVVITLTTYNAVPEQTDNEPLITASGLKITQRHIDRSLIVALPPELRDSLHLHWGDDIVIVYEEHGRQKIIKAQLWDSMNAKYNGDKRADLLVREGKNFKVKAKLYVSCSK